MAADAELLTPGELFWMWFTLIILALAFVIVGGAIWAGLASAASVKQNVAIHIYTPLAIVVTPASPTVPCDAPPGTAVATISYTYGDGDAIDAPTISPTGDFALSGMNIVVGPNGIAATNCGTTENVTITADQN